MAASSAASSSSSPLIPSVGDHCIAEGDWVVVVSTRGREVSRKCAEVLPVVELDKSGDKLVPVWGEEEEVEEAGGGDGRQGEILARQENQSLQREGILALREGGMAGDELIEALKEGSSTFSKRTEFSKAKWLKRKAGVHLNRLHVYRCDAATLASSALVPGCVLSNPPNMWCGLRSDSLSFVLLRAAIRPEACVLVVDGAYGIMTAAVAERMSEKRGGPIRGKILYDPNNGSHSMTLFERTGARMSKDFMRISLSTPPPALPSSIHIPPPLSLVVGEKRGAKDISRASDAMFPDRLIIAPRPQIHPGPLLVQALKWARPGSPFAVFHRNGLWIAEALAMVERIGVAVDTAVMEPFSRPIQVLPQRTHPTMQMDGFGGFVGYGTSILARSTLAKPSVETIIEEKQEEIRINQAKRRKLDSTKGKKGTEGEGGGGGEKESGGEE